MTGDAGLLFYYLAGLFRYPDFATVGKDLKTNPGWLTAVHDHHIRDVDRRLTLGDSASNAFLAIGPVVVLEEVHSLHEHLVSTGQYLNYPTATSLVPARNDHDLIIFLDFHSSRHIRLNHHQYRHYSGQHHPAGSTQPASLRLIVRLPQEPG